MMQVSKEKPVYCYTMEGNSCLFADERDKKHLLDLVGEIRQRDGWNLYAFCVMDNAAYFVIEANQIAPVVHELQSAVRKLLCQNTNTCRTSRRNSRTELSGRTKKLGTFVQIADCCREIHRIPLQQGYVERLEDYWWSSYPTYAGIQRWNSLDLGWSFR